MSWVCTYVSCRRMYVFVLRLVRVDGPLMSIGGYLLNSCTSDADSYTCALCSLTTNTLDCPNSRGHLCTLLSPPSLVHSVTRSLTRQVYFSHTHSFCPLVTDEGKVQAPSTTAQASTASGAALWLQLITPAERPALSLIRAGVCACYIKPRRHRKRSAKRRGCRSCLQCMSRD